MTADLLWNTDRSRYMTGLECEARRYYGYHAGPRGLGWSLRALSMPLATGTYVHQALAEILRGTPPDAAIAAARSAYLDEASARGFDQEDVPNALLVDEQAALVEGVCWGWWKAVLPELLNEFEIIEVEQEHNIQLPWPSSASRQGSINWMVRPDFVARHKTTGIVSVHDFKTMAYLDTDSWAESLQMMMQTLAVKEAKHFYVHALVKGARKQEYDPETKDYTGPKQQQSVLVYGYRMPGAPPLTQDQWEPKFKYAGSDGRNHTLGRGWNKEPVWKHMPMREWIDQVLPTDVLCQNFALLGPFRRNDYAIGQFLRALPTNETRWVDNLEKLYEAEGNLGWEAQQFQELLDRTLVRNYSACRGILDHKLCRFYRLCYKQAGWQQPESWYDEREPHHEQECIE